MHRPATHPQIPRRSLLQAGLALLAMPLAARHAVAGDPSREEIVRALLPERAGPKVRSLSRSVTRGIAIEGELPPELDLPSISLTINFEYDSARLTNDGMLTLRALGAALKDERLKGMQFQIAGHTDAKGTADYNMQLSLRRADAVVTHLTSFYGIPRDRLAPVGYGHKRLSDTANPLAGANRRVEIINVTPLS